MFALNLPELRQLVSAIDLSDPFGARTYFMIVLFVHTGLRVNELVSLDVQHVSWQGIPRDSLYVPKSIGKGGRDRKVPLNPVAQKAIAKLLAFSAKRGFSVAPEAPLFVTRYHQRITVRSVQRLMVALREKAGLTVPASPHALRHSFIDMVNTATGNPRITQVLAGHRRLSTIEIYTRPTEAMLRQAVNRVAGL